MNRSKLFTDALQIIRTKNDYCDFESCVKFGLVADLIKNEPESILDMSGREYKDMFMILTTMLMIDFSDDFDYNSMLTAGAFYCAYRCIDKGIECNERLYDDVYSSTNNLLYIYGHRYIVSILTNAKLGSESVYNPFTRIEISDADLEVYKMEAAQLLNNLRLTYSENLFIDRLNYIQSVLPNGITNDISYLNTTLRRNQEILFKYISTILKNGEHDF